MVDDVLTNRVVLVHHRRDLELGAHAVSRRDENHVLARRDLVKTAKRSDITDDGSRLRRSNHLLDGADGIHLDVNVDTRLGIRGLGFLGHDSQSSKS